MRAVAGEDVEDDMRELDEAMGEMDTVVQYLGDGGLQVKDIVGGKRSIQLVSKYMGYDASNMTAMEFYNVVEKIREEGKKAIKRR